MKPTVVQFPQSLNIALADLARDTARHGRIAYALSLVLASAMLAGSVFYKEITHTFGHYVLGVGAVAWWQGLLLILGCVWLASLLLGTLSVAQRGRGRKFGIYSIAINVATALLAICTLI